MCRVRNAHTGPPWTTAYVCITIDESALDENGKITDKPLTLRMVQWQPFCVTKPFDSKTPVCSACKKTNRTRSFCRDRHRHRLLPWCTVYVLLSAVEQTDPSTIVAGTSRPVQSDEEEASSNGDAKRKSVENASATGSDTIRSDADHDGDDINDIADSKTFLCKVSIRGCSIHWLELSESEGAEIVNQGYENAEQLAGTYGHPHTHIEHAHQQHAYYAHHYAAQQNALKSHQHQLFFQMQQRGQYPPPHPWQHPPPPFVALPHVEFNGGSPGVAGEAAAIQQRRQSEENYNHHHAWMMYYQQTGQYPHHPPGEIQSPPVGGYNQSPPDTPPEADGENDRDHKRRRAV